MDFRLGRAFDFDSAPRFAARIVDELDERAASAGTLLNVNVPAGSRPASRSPGWASGSTATS